jgi:hypothetical protein
MTQGATDPVVSTVGNAGGGCGRGAKDGEDKYVEGNKLREYLKVLESEAKKEYKILNCWTKADQYESLCAKDSEHTQQEHTCTDISLCHCRMLYHTRHASLAILYHNLPHKPHY